MSLLMQALRRAETAKKGQVAATPADPAQAAPAAAAPANGEMTLESKEPTADELAAAAEHAQQAAEAAAAAQAAAEAAAFASPTTAASPFDAAPAPVTEPVDYFGGEVPPARAPYVPPAPQGFDPERGAGAGSAAPPPVAPAAPAYPDPSAAAPHSAAPARQPGPARPNAAPASQPEPAPEQAAAARGAARAMFAAKQDVRGRRPLIIAAIGLLLLGAGAGIFYFMLLPPEPFRPAPFPQGATGVLVATPPVADPVPAANVVPLDPGTAAPTGANVPTSATATPAAPSEAVFPAASAARAPVSPAPPRAAVSRSARASDPDDASAAAPRVRVVRAQGAVGAAPARDTQIEVRRVEATRNVNPTLVGAYQAFVAGDAAGARGQYQRVLQQEPDNRDALLGMAAIAANRGQSAEAGSFYARLLELDPSDAQAAAGMAALQSGDPGQAESRLKSVLATSPESGAALFALGNLYAQQARWPEAQLAYFRAVGSEPANAGYAFNLAVSLDKLNQKKLALDYYRRALQLAQKGGATVDQAATTARIRQLESAPSR